MNNSSYRRKALDEYGHVCAVCGETENLEVHHRDGDRTNNTLDNLLPLCVGCHQKLHKEGLKGLEDELLPPEERSHIDADAVNYQFQIDDEKWDAWKDTVPRSKSLEDRIIELIEADTEGRVREPEDDE